MATQEQKIDLPSKRRPIHKIMTKRAGTALGFLAECFKTLGANLDGPWLTVFEDSCLLYVR